MVAHFNRCRNLLDAPPLGLSVPGASFSSHQGARREIHLDGGIREHDRADVAPFHHSRARPLIDPRALHIHQKGSHSWVSRHLTDRASHSIGAYIECNRFAIKGDPSLGVVNAVLLQFSEDVILTRDVAARLKYRESRSSIGCARVEIDRSEPVGNSARHRALSHSTWTIYCNYHSFSRNISSRIS